MNSVGLLFPRGERTSNCRGTVQLPVGLQHAGAEVLDDPRQRRTPRLHYPARRMIGVDHVHAEVDEVLRCGTFAAADAAGEAENPGFFHRGIHCKPTNCQ